tara:strand:- start:13 stop:540 length:528 start_codon:yes stop_codon:yes gene_type:complete
VPEWFERAHASLPRRAALLLAGLLSGVIAWGFALLLALLTWRWLSQQGLPAQGLAIFRSGGAIATYVALTVAHELGRWACRPYMARAAVAVFEHDQVRLYRPEGIGILLGKVIGDYTSRPWDRLAGYSDDHGTWIDLVATQHRRARFLMVPTRTPKERARVLASLEARGLKRLSS